MYLEFLEPPRRAHDISIYGCIQSSLWDFQLSAYFLFLIFFFILWPHLHHMEIPRLGVKLELQLRPTPQP